MQLVKLRAVGVPETVCVSTKTNDPLPPPEHADPDASRGGRPKLYFTLTAYGKKTLQDTLEVRIGFWKSLPETILKLN